MQLRRMAKLVAIVVALTATAATAAEITLFEHQNFSGGA
jgi:hypothetical protein